MGALLDFLQYLDTFHIALITPYTYERGRLTLYFGTCHDKVNFYQTGMCIGLLGSLECHCQVIVKIPATLGFLWKKICKNQPKSYTHVRTRTHTTQESIV